MSVGVVLMSVAEVIGAAAFLYIAYLFTRVYRRLGDESALLFSTSYIFLGIAQVCALLSITAPSPRLATAFYIATSSLAVAGFISMLGSIEWGSKLYTLPLPILLISPDLVAGALSAIVSLRSTRVSKFLISLLSISFFFRGFSVAVASSISPVMLFIAEILRAAAAVALSLHHVSRALIYEWKEEV